MRSFTQKSRAHIATAATWIEETTGAHPIAIGQLMFIAWMVIVAFGVGYSINSEANKKLEAEIEAMNNQTRHYASFVEKANLYASTNAQHFAAMVIKSNTLTKKMVGYINSASDWAKVTPLEVKALIAIESGFACPEKNQFSSAIGCMQIVLSYHRTLVMQAASKCGLNIDLPRRLIKNHCVNIHVGAMIYRQLLDQFDNRYLAALAYNVGPGKVEEMLAKAHGKNFSEFVAMFPSDLEIIRKKCESARYKRSNRLECANVLAESKRPTYQRKNVFVQKFLAFISRARPSVDLLQAHRPEYDLS